MRVNSSHTAARTMLRESTTPRADTAVAAATTANRTTGRDIGEPAPGTIGLVRDNGRPGARQEDSPQRHREHRGRQKTEKMRRRVQFILSFLCLCLLCVLCVSVVNPPLSPPPP